MLKDRPTKWEFPELPYPIGVVFSLRKLTLHMLYIGLRNVYQHHASITEYVEEVRKCRLLAPYILFGLSSGVVVCLVYLDICSLNQIMHNRGVYWYTHVRKCIRVFFADEKVKICVRFIHRIRGSWPVDPYTLF